MGNCGCKNKVAGYVDISNLETVPWDDAADIIGRDECGNIIAVDKPLDELSEEDREKLDDLVIDGEGNNFLADDGTYKPAKTTDHRELTEESRSALNQHPIEAITGLDFALRQKVSAVYFPNILYATDPNGAPLIMPYGEQPNGGQMVERDGYGHILLPPYLDAVGNQAISQRQAEQLATNAANSKVSKLGDTMTGPLALNADPALDMQAANKKYVDEQIAAKESGALTFQGFIQTTEPTGDVREGNYWLNSDVLPTSFPVTVSEWNGTDWATQVEYTPTAFDLWDSGGNAYYYFGDKWNQVNFAGSTFNNNQFEVVNGVVGLKPGGISDTEIAENAQIKQSKIEGLVDELGTTLRYDENDNIPLHANTQFLATLESGNKVGILGLSSQRVLTAMTTIPVGYNLRGKTVDFTHTEKYPPATWNGNTQSLSTGQIGSTVGYLSIHLNNYQTPDIYILWRPADGSQQRGSVIFEDGLWSKTSFTFPDDQDYIVRENTLPIHEGDNWGFDYAYIVEEINNFNNGSIAAHWNGNTNDDPDYGINPTWDTPEGKKVGAYMDDLETPSFATEAEAIAYSTANPTKLTVWLE